MAESYCRTLLPRSVARFFRSVGRDSETGQNARRLTNVLFPTPKCTRGSLEEPYPIDVVSWFHSHGLYLQDLSQSFVVRLVTTQLDQQPMAATYWLILKQVRAFSKRRHHNLHPPFIVDVCHRCTAMCSLPLKARLRRGEAKRTESDTSRDGYLFQLSVAQISEEKVGFGVVGDKTDQATRRRLRLRWKTTEYLMGELQWRRQHAANVLNILLCRSYLSAGRRIPLKLRMSYFFDVSGKAVRRYSPKPYDAKVVLLRSEVAGDYSRSAWRELIPNQLEVHELPGQHLDPIQGPNVKAWGSQLNACLVQILSTNGS